MTYCAQWREMPESTMLIEAEFSRVTHDMIHLDPLATFLYHNDWRAVTVEQNAVV
jgi:hypothetical protein